MPKENKDSLSHSIQSTEENNFSISTDANENPLRSEKRRKLHEIRKMGINPYPYSFEKNVDIQFLRDHYENQLNTGEKKQEMVFKIAGRLMTLRHMGKASFFNIQDQSGNLQVYIKTEELSQTEIKIFENLDLGDILGIEGYIFKTQKGEFSIYTKKLDLLTKSLEPLPEKFHGIADVEIKYRHRHLDLISSKESRKVFETRSRIIREIRKFMESKGFLEVETPVLQPLYGGAAAHPFSTHHRALDMQLFMKISPELYLKRLIVGGFEKVFEIGKNFRNEGIDRTHNPEFTMMEWYEAYTDYQYQMNQFEELVCHLVMTIHGRHLINFQGKEINFKPPWRRLTIYEGIRETVGIDPEKLTAQEIYHECKKRGSKLEVASTHGEMVMELFELSVEPTIWQPTFVMDHPIEVSPLTKVHRLNSHLVERFEPFIAGMEVGNSYSELNDPEEQYRRLKEQELQRMTNEEAHPMDEDFMNAIDTGMPPTGGVGLGIERIVMLLTDQASIRDIILFPTMKFKES